MSKVICLVGCGFLGSHLVDQLSKLMFSQEIGARYSLRLIDFDTWDERNPANQFVGTIDEVRIYPIELTATQILDIYNREVNNP